MRKDRESTKITHNMTFEDPSQIRKNRQSTKPRIKEAIPSPEKKK